MPEHWIRLRGGWEWQPREPAAPARRLTLPTIWPSDRATLARLARSFQRPPYDPQTESLWLSLDKVPGLVGALLNGVPIAGGWKDAGEFLVPLDDLPSRNRLVLDVETHADGEWGAIALVIRERVEGKRLA